MKARIAAVHPFSLCLAFAQQKTLTTNAGAPVGDNLVVEGRERACITNSLPMGNCSRNSCCGLKRGNGLTTDDEREEKRLTLHGWVYDIEKGSINVLEAETGGLVPLATLPSTSSPSSERSEVAA